MADTATAYRRSAWETSPPSAVEASFGLLTAQPSPLALHGSSALTRLLTTPRPLDAALRPALCRRCLGCLTGALTLVEPAGVSGRPGALMAWSAADGVGRADSAVLIDATRSGEVAAVEARKTGSCR